MAIYPTQQTEQNHSHSRSKIIASGFLYSIKANFNVRYWRLFLSVSSFIFLQTHQQKLFAAGFASVTSQTLIHSYHHTSKIAFLQVKLLLVIVIWTIFSCKSSKKSSLCIKTKSFTMSYRFKTL